MRRRRRHDVGHDAAMRPAGVRRDEGIAIRDRSGRGAAAMRPAGVRRDEANGEARLRELGHAAMRPAGVRRDEGSRYSSRVACGNGTVCERLGSGAASE
jgi:hypothetical protein